jgi:hypothetical protein
MLKLEFLLCWVLIDVEVALNSKLGQGGRDDYFISD